MNHRIQGYNECLITYVLAASSPDHGIPAEVYHEGWARRGGFLPEASESPLKLRHNGKEELGFTY